MQEVPFWQSHAERSKKKNDMENADRGTPPAQKRRGKKGKTDEEKLVRESSLIQMMDGIWKRYGLT